MAQPEKLNLKLEDNEMKKAMNRAIIAIMSLALTGILLTGCGTNQQNPETEVSPIIPLETQGPVAAEPIEEAVEATEETPAAAEETAKEPQQETERFEDNFAVSSEAAKEFAMKIQDVTARKVVKLRKNVYVISQLYIISYQDFLIIMLKIKRI